MERRSKIKGGELQGNESKSQHIIADVAVESSNNLGNYAKSLINTKRV